MRVERVDEVEEGRALQAGGLQLRVLSDVRGGEGRGADAHEVLGVPLVVEELRSGHAHQLGADAEDPHLLDVGRAGGSGAGEPHPGAEGPGLGEDAVAPLGRYVVSHRELAANHPVRLGVPRALELARRVMQAHVGGHVRDDRVEEGLLAGEGLFLREPQALIPAPQIDEGLDQGGEGFSQDGVERRTKERVDAPLQLHELDGRVVESLEEHRAASSGDEPFCPGAPHCMPARAGSTRLPPGGSRGLPMRRCASWLVLAAGLVIAGCGNTPGDLEACARSVWGGVRPVAEDRTRRFLGQVGDERARCRGGARALELRRGPWVAWPLYWATGDGGSRVPGMSWGSRFVRPDQRGLDGALIDLEYQRVELIRFNLYDNSGTYPQYVRGGDGVPGRAIRVWPEMRLPPGHPAFAAVGGDGVQRCAGALIRHRTLTGICNDIRNPLMGASGMPFARNVEFEATFPELGATTLARNRHGARLGLLRPDPQVISRRLLSRASSPDDRCHAGRGLPGYSVEARCDYKTAPSLNVLAAFWIQFMTHDWFSHLDDGHNAPSTMTMGCLTERIEGIERPLTAEAAARLGCRAGDRIDVGTVAESAAPPSVRPSRPRASRARVPHHAQHRHRVVGRVAAVRPRRDVPAAGPARSRRPRQAATCWFRSRAWPPATRLGYLPVFGPDDPINPQWAGQEAAAFPDNWSIGPELLSQRVRARAQPLRGRVPPPGGGDPGRRLGTPSPRATRRMLRYRDVDPDDALRGRAARHRGGDREDAHDRVDAPAPLRRAPEPRPATPTGSACSTPTPISSGSRSSTVLRTLGRSGDADPATAWYSVFASGPGIFGLGSRVGTPTARPGGGRRRPILEPREPRSRQRRDQSLRVAVQLSRGVRDGVPAASDAAGSPRGPRRWTRTRTSSG